MREGTPSRTALAVAVSRAAHQIADRPRVLDDPIAVPIIGAQGRRGLSGGTVKLGRATRFWLAARSRTAEDALATAVVQGVAQYVVLGAGLDTFAYRNPFDGLRVFEVDHPATQAWKRGLLATEGIGIPPSVVFAPVDFEQQTLGQGLAAAGFDTTRPAFFTWLGVTMHLSPDAFRSTLGFVGALPLGSGIALDYLVDRRRLGFAERIASDVLAGLAGRVGETIRLSFSPEAMASELRAVGLERVEDGGVPALVDRFGVPKLGRIGTASVGFCRIATAWRGI